MPVDCGAIPESLIESEFFGHERGAFTGAESRRIGLLEFADHGTFFLDELGELPLVLQAKLLRTLQERKIRRVGGREEIAIDVRVVAATARPLEEMIRQERFRQDLYYRINVVEIDLPPLRERGDDIGLLAEYLAVHYSREMNRDIRGITPEAYQVLAQYRWPGNVRELQNVIRRGIALAKDKMLGLDDLPDEVIVVGGRKPAGRANLGYFALRDQHLAAFEVDYLRELLDRHDGDVRTAARKPSSPRHALPADEEARPRRASSAARRGRHERLECRGLGRDRIHSPTVAYVRSFSSSASRAAIVASSGISPRSRSVTNCSSNRSSAGRASARAWG